MSQKIPEAVQRILQLAKPTYVNGRWRKPVASGRELAAIRKQMIADGVDWPAKPFRDRSADRPLKLSKWERERPERQRQIEENMHKMPEMIAEYRKSRRELREKTRKSKEKSAQEKYLIATGQMEQEAAWELFKERAKK